MATLYMMVGLPGSGKTTEAKKLEHEYKVLRLTPDEWQYFSFGHDISDPEHDERHTKVEEHLMNGQDCLKFLQRKNWINKLWFCRSDKLKVSSDLLNWNHPNTSNTKPTTENRLHKQWKHILIYKFFFLYATYATGANANMRKTLLKGSHKW